MDRAWRSVCFRFRCADVGLGGARADCDPEPYAGDVGRRLGCEPSLSGCVLQDLERKHTEVELIPYSGSAPALADLLGGRVDVMFDPMPSSIAHVRHGELIPLAVTTLTRSQALPNVPAMSDFVPGYEAGSWFGIGAPRETPADIRGRLNAAVGAGLTDVEIKAHIADLGGTTMPGPAAEFGAFIARETEKYGNVIRTAKITVR